MWTTFEKPYVNRYCTVVVHLNTVEEGGAMCFTWMGKVKGVGGASWYEKPMSYATTAKKGQAEPKLSVNPERGLALVYFPCTTVESGGFIDFNTTYMGEPAFSEKYTVLQHIYSDKHRISNTSRGDYPHKGRLSVDEC